MFQAMEHAVGVIGGHGYFDAAFNLELMQRLLGPSSEKASFISCDAPSLKSPGALAYRKPRSFKPATVADRHRHRLAALRRPFGSFTEP